MVKHLLVIMSSPNAQSADVKCNRFTSIYNLDVDGVTKSVWWQTHARITDDVWYYVWVSVRARVLSRARATRSALKSWEQLVLRPILEQYV